MDLIEETKKKEDQKITDNKNMSANIIYCV